MRHRDIVRKVAKDTGLPAHQIKEILTAHSEALVDALRSGDSVFIHGIGRIHPKESPRKTYVLKGVVWPSKYLIKPKLSPTTELLETLN